MPISSEHRTADSIFKYLSKESICDFRGSASLLNVSIKSIQQFIAAQILLNFLPFRINEVGRCVIPWDSLSWNLRNLSFKCTNVNSWKTFKWQKFNKVYYSFDSKNFPDRVKKTISTNKFKVLNLQFYSLVGITDWVWHLHDLIACMIRRLNCWVGSCIKSLVNKVITTTIIPVSSPHVIHLEENRNVNVTSNNRGVSII